MRVHRLVGRASGGWVTRGDGAPAPDEPAALQDVLGRVAEVERAGRRVRLGLGPERVCIALLSRFGLLGPLVRAYRRVAEGVATSR